MAELILVVEDENKIARLTRDYLENHGFQVVTAADGQAGLAAFRRERPALVILDLMLPELDGREVCRILRRESDVPIIMLTALSEEIDQVTGLEIGADDYITKPFSPRALVARVRALLRRARGRVETVARVCVNDLEIDQERYTASYAGQALYLTPNEFKLLHALASHAGRPQARGQLMEAMHGRATPFDRSVDSHIKNLRKKLDEAGGVDLIETVYGVGYRLTEGAGRE